MGSIKDLIGATIKEIVNNHNRELIFHLSNGEVYCLHHTQEGFEDVYIEKIEGDLNSLNGLKVVNIKIVENCENNFDILDLGKESDYAGIIIESEGTIISIFLRKVHDIFEVTE